jgi:hypothetical protein
VDAAIRISDTLYLFECVSIERPLDFEIGKISTINHRNEELDKKVEQALTLRNFVTANPAGHNYDFSWATEICVFVVSPFVEWIWSRSERLWHNDTVPRILSAEEALAYMREKRDRVV